MAENAENLVDELNDFQLPALTENKKQFSNIVDRPTTSHADLAAIVGSDPGLSLSLFRALTQLPKRPAETISNLAHIISLLGVDNVRSLVNRTPTLEEKYRGPGLLGLRKTYGRALLTGAFARRLATLRGKVDVEADATTAMLQCLGEMVLWAKKPGTMSVIGDQQSFPEERDLRARHHFNICPSEIGETLATRWELPESVIRSQHFSSSFDPNSQLPLLASALAWTVERNWRSRQTAELMDLAAELTHLDLDLVRAQLHREIAEAARQAHALSLPFSADQMVQRVSDGNAQAPAVVEPADQPVFRATSPDRKVTAKPSPPPSTKPPEKPEKATTKPGPIQQHIVKVLEQVRDELGMERVLFAMVTPDRTRIRARYVLDKSSSGLNSFSVSAKSRNLFALLVHKPHAVWVNSGNQVKYLPYIPEEIAGLIHSSNFLAASIVIKAKPVGVVYADAGHGPIDQKSFTAFKKLCQELTAGLGGK